MGWKSMGRYLPQVAEVTRIFGDALADKVEERNPKLAPIVRGGLKAMEKFADEAGANATASLQVTGGQYSPQGTPYPQQDPVLEELLIGGGSPYPRQIPYPQQDHVLEELLMEQYYRQQLAAEGAPDGSSFVYGEGGAS